MGLIIFLQYILKNGKEFTCNMSNERAQNFYLHNKKTQILAFIEQKPSKFRFGVEKEPFCNIFQNGPHA